MILGERYFGSREIGSNKVSAFVKCTKVLSICNKVYILKPNQHGFRCTADRVYRDFCKLL